MGAVRGERGKHVLSRRAVLSLIPGVVFSTCREAPRESPLRYRWVYISHNPLVGRNVETVLALMRRGKAVGYNGSTLVDHKL